MKTLHHNRRSHTSRTRDAALQRLTHANRWLIAGSVVLTGVLTDVAANAFPGHRRATGSTRAAGAKQKKHTQARHHALQPPAKAPTTSTSTQAAPPVTTQQTQATPPAQEEAQTPAPSEEAPTAETQAPEAPAREEAPAPSSETHETAPAPEPQEPVVSGGS